MIEDDFKKGKVLTFEVSKGSVINIIPVQKDSLKRDKNVAVPILIGNDDIKITVRVGKPTNRNDALCLINYDGLEIVTSRKKLLPLIESGHLQKVEVESGNTTNYKQKERSPYFA